MLVTHFDFVSVFVDVSLELRNIIKWMMNPDPRKRPDVNTLLSLPRIQRILAHRKMLTPVRMVVSTFKASIKWKTFFKSNFFFRAEKVRATHHE